MPEAIRTGRPHYCHSVHVLEKHGFAAEAHDLNFKARNIKILKPDTEHWRVNYLFDQRDKFCGFTLVRVSSWLSIAQKNQSGSCKRTSGRLLPSRGAAARIELKNTNMGENMFTEIQD
jgi:hypothetical protein